MRFTRDENYKRFNERLAVTHYPLVGVRVPTLRTMAKKLIKENKWNEVLVETPQYYEDVQLQSFILAAAPMAVNERQQQLEAFFPKMDNWQVVDGLCTSLKEVTRYESEYWQWLKTLRISDETFVIRFVVVMYLTYYLGDKYLEDVLTFFETIEHDDYYVKMAVAWALSIAFIKNEEKLTAFFQETNINRWTYNKALQKIIESRQITAEMKQKVRNWKC